MKALADIEVAIKVLNTKSSIENPIDRAYQQLDCVLKPLDINDDNYKLISKYLHKTHASTHNTYKMKILDIFDVYKQLEHDRFKDFGNKMLLWHGSRISNWAGILSQGLKIAPPEAPSTGYMVRKVKIYKRSHLTHFN
jgi:poly [ADP-ribose] polymerase